MDQRETNNNQLEQPEENRIQKTEESISSLWDNFKRSNIRIMGVPKGKEKEQNLEIYF